MRAGYKLQETWLGVVSVLQTLLRHYGNVNINLPCRYRTQFQFGAKPRKIISTILNFFKHREGIVIFVLILQLSILGILYSSISGTENNRFFLQLTSYLFVLSAVLISIAIRIFISAYQSIISPKPVMPSKQSIWCRKVSV